MYFGDSGLLFRDLNKWGLHGFLGFAALPVALIGGDEPHVDRAMAFCGLRGGAPIPGNDMPRMISLPRRKEEIRASIERDFSPNGGRCAARGWWD